MNRSTRTILISFGALALLAGAFLVSGSAGASVNTQMQAARDTLANCRLLAANSTGDQRRRATDCMADQTRILQLLGATPSPTPTVVPTTAPPTTAPPTPTPPPTTPPPSSVCPAWPATPNASCTGYQHTGVTLTSCPTWINTPGTYDRCRFNGIVTIAAAGVVIKRSLVDGGHVEGTSGSDLRGAVFEDFQIIGGGDDGSAAIGNNNYTCRRCDISKGNRGFALGSNVVIVDSFAHDFYRQPASQQGPNSVHQTAISTHGGSNIRVIHSTLDCRSDGYACSAGFAFYSEDAPGITDVEVRNCRITTDAGYGMLFGTLIPGKPYPITNTRVIDNTIGSDEFGPVANWPGNQPGNVWSGNTTTGGVVLPG